MRRKTNEKGGEGGLRNERTPLPMKQAQETIMELSFLQSKPLVSQPHLFALCALQTLPFFISEY